MISGKYFIPLIILVFPFQVLSQTEYYVSKTGSDSNTGISLTDAWESIQHAMNNATPNSHINIRAGTYLEKVEINVSGLTNEPIVFRPYQNEEVILDGTGINSTEAIIGIFDHSNIHIEGLILQNSIMPDAQGIIIEGKCSGIRIRNNEIRNIHFSGDPNDLINETTNSQPLIVYGTSGTIPISDLVIESNMIHNARTGYSEGLAVNGNVVDFTISKNRVFDISNIGIDIIGHEGTAPSAVDQARRGTVSGNIVYNCKSPYATAAGIYVDGGKELIIEKNIIYNCQWGIEVGCENLNKTTSDVTVINNIIYANDDACIAMGGYDFPVGSGKVIDCIIANNTCYNNDVSDTGVGEVSAEINLTYSENCQIINNIFYTNNPGGIMLHQDAVNPLNLSLDYNLYFPTSLYEYEYNGIIYNTLTAYQSGTGQDQHSIHADPLFVNPSISDFELLDNSPAIDAGDPMFNLAMEDFKENNRIINNRVDIGALEYYLSTNTHIEVDPDFISIYPNPVANKVYIDGNRSSYTILLLSILGNVIELLDEPTPVEIDLSSLPTGTYFLSVYHQNNPKLHIQKIIVE